MITISEQWKQTYPDAGLGVLVMEGVLNPPEHAGLEQIKTQFEGELRSQYGGVPRASLEDLPNIRPYVDYYKRFNKTYHVLMQLESVASKGRNLPRVAALVEAMFIAELRNGLLTAGHDLDSTDGPLTADVAAGDEAYTLLSGQTQTLKAGDLYIRDQAGVISSIIYGPDQRTPITPATKRVIFTIYAPAGIQPETVLAHLADIRQYAELVSPTAKTIMLEYMGWKQSQST